MTVLELAGELIRLLSVQMSALKPLITPLAEYLQNLWRETGEADPSRCTILEVSAVPSVVCEYFTDLLMHTKICFFR